MPSTSAMYRSSGAVASYSRPCCTGELHLVNNGSDEVLATRRLSIGHDLNIGRDRTGCQWVLADPRLSAKHLRIYTVVYDNEEEGQLEYLVYAEDLSRYGTYWNGSLIGKGNGGYLLSHNDKLRLSPKTSFRFVTPNQQPEKVHFDLLREKEMTHFRHEYVVTDRLLGSGSFGRVFMAIEQHSRTQVACKVVDLSKLEQTTSAHFVGAKQPKPAKCVNQTVQTAHIKTWLDHKRRGSQLEERLRVYYREVKILSQLSHPNIISLDKVYITDNTMYIFQELVTAGDLFSYLESKNGRLAEVEAAVILRQVLIALQFLHDHNIVHRDLKPENILMTNLATGCRVVLTDFGAARQLGRNQRMTSVIGSVPYAAPELKKTDASNRTTPSGYTKAVDMWSVGAIAAVLLTGGPAFSDPLTGAYSPVLARTGNLNSLKKSREWQQLRPRSQDFVAGLLVVDEQQRLTVQQALLHEWFTNGIHKTDFEELYQRTIKNWHPRMVKRPNIEFTQSTFVRHLEPSQLVLEEKKRPRQDKKPVDPPYKPFPRNMHIPLWPQRKSSGQPMPEEASKAIDTNWTGSAKRISSRFKRSVQSAQLTHDRRNVSPTELTIRKELEAAGTVTKQKELRPIVRKSRSLPPLELDINSEIAKPDNRSMESAYVNADVKTTIPKQKLSSESQPSLSHSLNMKTPETGFHSPIMRRRHGLRHSSRTVNTARKPKQQRLHSVFDLHDDNILESSDTDSDRSSSKVFKRPKLTATQGSPQTKAADGIVVAHNTHIMLDPEVADTEL